MMSNRPAEPKNARNKNVLVVGGSGSGKTRFWLKPNLLQCHSSYVVTDPKGSIGVECGEALLKHGYKLKFFNTINFSKSMRYNPMAYIHSEKDVLKLVTALMTNTKGEGQGGDPFWDKAERLLLVSLIAYLHYEAPVEEQNFATLLEMLNTMQVSEDDETYQNPVDLLFEDQQRYQNKDRKQDCYICGSYKKRTRDCTAHFIRTDLLTAGVLSNLRQVTEYAAKHESRFVKLLIQQNEIGGKRKTAAATKQLEQAQERISEISRMIKRLYEDNVNGKISDERFMELSADYEAEQAELKKRAAALQAELDKSQAATVNAEKFMGIVRKHLAFEELTPTLLREMVEKIVVHECSYDENGTRRQDIEIYYSFVGKIDLPE